MQAKASFPFNATQRRQQTQRTQRKNKHRFYPCVLAVRRLRQLRQKVRNGLALRALRWVETIGLTRLLQTSGITAREASVLHASAQYRR